MNQLKTLIVSANKSKSAQGSFYVQSHKRVLNRVDLWKKTLPSVKPFYAVKCNPDSQLIEWLANEGLGFDCASANEINKIPACSKEEIKTSIIYANPCKPPLDISYAIESDLNLTVVDSEEEIDKLVSLKWQGDALLRIKVNDSGSLMPFSSKFGCELDKISSLAKYAKHRSLRLLGISFHVGSGSTKASQYLDAIGVAHQGLRTLLLEGHTPHPLTSQIIDIGGGFTINNFKESSFAIQTALNKYKHFQCIAEPGRFFAEASQDLFTQVIGKKGNSFTIDESIYGQFSCIPFDHAKPVWYRIPFDNQARKRKKTDITIFGRTCDSVDVIAMAEEAEELKVGDWLWWPNMGAYTNVTATEFNGFPLPPKIVIEEDISIPGFLEKPKNISYVSCVKSPLLI